MARYISYFFSIILLTSYAHPPVHSSEWDSSEYDSRDFSDDDSFEDYPSEDYELSDSYEEKENIKNKEIDKYSAHISKSHPEKTHHDSDSNQALLTLESGPSAVVANCVNAISGDFFDSHMALTTPGPQPLVVQCSYCSSSKEWNFHHMPRLEVGKKSSTGKHLYAKYHDDNGSEIMYQTKVKDKNPAGIKGQLTVPKTLFDKGLTNCGSGEISGQTNWRNSNISYVYDKNKALYKLQHGSGIQRIFSKHLHKHKHGDAPEGKFNLDKEVHPNGNQLHYTYRDGRLWYVEAKNKNNIIFENLNVIYTKEFKSSKWSSQSENVIFRFEDDDNKRVTSILPSSAMNVGYEYKGEGQRLSKKILPEKQFLEIRYYPHGDFKGRVATLTSFKGITHKFYYLKGLTTVVDAENNSTEYYYNNNTKRLGTVIRYDNQKKLLTKDRFHWYHGDDTRGNLLGRTFEDDNKIYFQRKLEYDDFGNIKKNHLYGNLTGIFLQPLEISNGSPSSTSGVYVKTFDYSKDGKNLLLLENDGRKILLYGYYPETNLLKHRFTKDGNKIIKREFFAYDDNGILIEEIWDDGESIDKDNLLGITERHRKTITPTTEAPLGLPSIVTECYLDKSSSAYLLLKKTINTHNAQGKLKEQQHYGSDDTLAYVLTWDYDRLGNVVKKVDAEANVTTYKHDGNGNKFYEEGPLPGWNKTFTYDKVNCLREEIEVWPNGLTFTVVHDYNDLNQRISTKNAFGHTTKFTYNSLGHLTSTEGPKFYTRPKLQEAPVEKTEYDALGCPIVKKDAKGHVTTTAFTIRGKPYSIKYPNGSEERKEYSLDGLLVKEIAKNGLTTIYTHDCLGRITEVVMKDPQGTVVKKTSSSYSTFHLMTEIDENGLVTLYDYDGAGRSISKKKGDHVTLYEYDALSRVIKTTDSIDGINSRITCQTYDFLNRVREERIEDGNNNIFSLEEYEYDVHGNRNRVTVHIQASKAITETTYTPDGKPLTITDALGKKTIFEYDYNCPYKDQKVLKITKTDPLGNQEIKIHDTHGNVCCQMQRDPFGKIIQEECFYRDLLGQKILSQITVYKGEEQKRVIETEWQYDCMGNMFKSIEAKGTDDQKIIVNHFNSYGEKFRIDMPNGFYITNEYDILGRLSTYESSDESIHYTYEYDLKDNPILVKDLVHDTFTERTYDKYNRLESETLDSGLVLKYTYDQLDRPLTVTLPDQSSISYRYNAHQLVALDRIKDNKIAYTHAYKQYDLSGNVLEEILLENAGRINYEYDLLGRSISVQAPHWQETTLPDGFDATGNLLKREVVDKQGPVTYTYTYDNLYQLTSENGFISHSYENDSVYNRIERDSQPYTLNDLNQLLSQTGNTYDYDKNGNLVEKISGDEKTIYSYDALDRLIKVDDGSSITTYTYDSFHRRLGKTRNGIETKYFYHNQNEIGAYAEGKITQLRVLGLSYGAEIGAAVAFELDGNTYAPINDPLGNVVALLDQEGNLAESYRYTAFGEMEADSVHTVDNPWMYSSKRFDAETGFIYFGRRYYASDIGRWITPDPAGYADGPNLYAYVHNHPLAYIDPDGQLAFLLAPLAISLAIDFIVPTAITCIQPYVGVMACSFLAGLAQGYNLDFTPAALDPSTLACQQAGMTLGVMLNINPAKLGMNTVKKVGTDILKKEAIEATANVVASKFKKAFTWCKPQQALAQATQKTAQVAENSIAKTRMLPNLDTLSRAGQVSDREGLTKAGRALDKHGGRINSVFPKASGNPTNKNIQGQFHFDDILTHPKSVLQQKIHPKYGNIIDIKIPTDRGLRFSSEGKFIMFLEP